MRVAVQDNFLGGSRNNANMVTPSDGIRPRMQMFTWVGSRTASLTLTPGGNVPFGLAAFGSLSFDVTGLVALANDGVGPSPTDACEVLAGTYTGRIVLADRGTCTFTAKARNAQAAGAVGILIANNVAGALGPAGTDPLVTIGVFGITQASGAALKASLAAGPVTARMVRFEVDGAIDNTVIAHEWGHYLHHRLADCGLFQCSAMSEGWGDFIALHTIARDRDNLNGTFALATYSTSAFDPNSAYFGIRRVPYSVDFTRNALTSKHITNGVALPAVPTLPAEIEIEVDRSFAGIGQLALNVTATNDEGCETTVTRTANFWINVDDVPGSTNVDDVESPSTPWTATGVNAGDVWSRIEVAPFNRAWFGVDFASVSDTALESPALNVGTAPFIISFDHRFGFETNGGVAPFFDGGVIEISRNGGPFLDISTIVNPGYGGTLFVGSGNPLGGRQAFVGRNAAFPARETKTLNLGTALAGETVRIRFRIGTDEAAADLGWEIDDIRFDSITNLPFSAFVADQSKCRGVPEK